MNYCPDQLNIRNLGAIVPIFRPTMASIKIEETDRTGQVVCNYVLSTTVNNAPAEPAITKSLRLDVIPSFSSYSAQSSVTQHNEKLPRMLTYLRTFITLHLFPVFLPIGYPHTVTSDYTPYQIYDSLQAFASTIAGLLSSRAVLQSLGFDTDNATASSTATYATLISIVQNTISNLSTILFAHYASSRIAAEVKFYRFLADIVNDSAFVFDCLSPLLPPGPKIAILCLSSACRAVCGVAGGSAKAVLSAHFARDGNIGELNAKDGSQETVIGLMGMWVGGVVVSRVEGVWATWTWLFMLLGLHLWFNYCAVRHVKLTGLNLTRAGIVLQRLIMTGICMSVDEVGDMEDLFVRGNVLRGEDGRKLGVGELGVDFREFIRCVGGTTSGASGSVLSDTDLPTKLLDIFQDQRYLLWVDAKDSKAVIAFKEHASCDDQLRAWCHALRVVHYFEARSATDGTVVLEGIRETLRVNDASWAEFRQLITSAGWNIMASTLECGPGKRFKVSRS